MRNVRRLKFLWFFVVVIIIFISGTRVLHHSVSMPVKTSTSAPNIVTTPLKNDKDNKLKYPWHNNIVATTFWIGEIFDENLADGSQVCSAYDSSWAYHYSGLNIGKVSENSSGCSGSIVGGCDGVIENKNGNQTCQTESRAKSNGYFPTQFVPKENPFYLDLPYDDLNDAVAFSNRCQDIPWANEKSYVGHCTDKNFSYMKNRWVKMIGPNGNTCYGQIEDAGPSHDGLYHDTKYVFGIGDTRPLQKEFNNAGLDVSPALNGCLGFSELDGQDDKVSWQFIDDTSVPDGPWKRVITNSQVILKSQ